MNILILDCISGLSGDMFLSAGVDMGFDLEIINDLIKKLSYKDIKIRKRKVKRGHIYANSVMIPHELPKMQLTQMVKKIESLKIHERTKEIAILIIENLIKVESKFHRKDGTHLHGLSSLDTLIDAISVGLIVEWLKIEKAYISLINVSKPKVKNSQFPLLSPATLELIKGFPLNYVDIDEEILTPTGASIILTLCRKYSEVPTFIAKKIGYGAGIKNIKNFSNFSRLIYAESKEVYDKDSIVIIETTVDDMNPIALSHLMESLFKKGALDVYFNPVYMKKNRIGIEIKILSHEDNLAGLIDELFENTTTFGLRYYEAKRKVLKREERFINLYGRKIRVKIGKIGDRIIRISPEYEDCKVISKEENISFFDVYEKVKSLFRSKI
jgi:hypothetical protein